MADEFKGDTYTKVTRQVFGDEATRLEANGRKALLEGRLGEATQLGFESMAAGAVHVADRIGAEAKRLVTGGEAVKPTGAAPATPATPAGPGKDQPTR